MRRACKAGNKAKCGDFEELKIQTQHSLTVRVSIYRSGSFHYTWEGFKKDWRNMSSSTIIWLRCEYFIIIDHRWRALAGRKELALNVPSHRDVPYMIMRCAHQQNGGRACHTDKVAAGGGHGWQISRKCVFESVYVGVAKCSPKKHTGHKRLLKWLHTLWFLACPLVTLLHKHNCVFVLERPTEKTHLHAGKPLSAPINLHRETPKPPAGHSAALCTHSPDERVRAWGNGRLLLVEHKQWMRSTRGCEYVR